MSQSHKVADDTARTSRHLVSTKAAEKPCGRCAAQTLTALAEGLTVHVDATPLDQAGEIAALLAGRDTYTHTITGQLVQRTASRITGGWLTGTLHASHKCPPNAIAIQEVLF